jgi:hypothetical protein
MLPGLLPDLRELFLNAYLQIVLWAIFCCY